MKRFLNELYTPFFEADGNEGGGDGGDSNNNDTGADDASKRTVTMTQADLDALIGREKGRATKKFSDYDDLKAERDRLKAAEEERNKAAMSAQERLEAEKAEALKRAEEADAERDKTLQAANQRLVKAEFRAQARELGIRADALDDAYKLADLSAVTVDDEGNAAGVEDVVKALLTNKPYLAEQAKPKPKEIGGGSAPEDTTQKTNEQLLKEAADKARMSGKPEDFAAYSALKLKLGSK